MRIIYDRNDWTVVFDSQEEAQATKEALENLIEEKIEKDK